MHSEAPAATFVPEPAAQAVSPILHETVIANPAENAVEDGATLPHFAPGTGVLEEETLDEEDYNTTLHASSIEEMDDFDEEETLEGAADLGTMIREMSIDQITRSGNVDEEEEDDLEEEDAIHDPLTDDLDDNDEEDLDESDTEEDVLHEEFSEGSEVTHANGVDHAQADTGAPAQDRSRDIERRSGRRDSGRRDGRRFGRSDRGDRSDRPRNTGGAGDRERSSGGGRDRRGRSSMQSTNLPAISELLKPGQEILVQIAKEPIAKKGARITSHIALPGRFLVFMPTVNHTGVSRKIESDGERRRLKEILLSEKGDAAGGFIVRTAASGASEEELRSDLRFLLNLWADIKSRSESSKSPALIYHDLNLVERILRDQVTDNFSAIWVDTETDYERILRFLQRFQPSLIRRVKLYTKETPLFEQFGITEEINKALRSKVWLKSGGSIVINQTEALVAIDINTGKFVGKTARLEDTIVKTNLDAIPEIVRQIRLRDLGGIIIIDFIDMDERKNRNKVMAALEEELKSDRAPSKVLQFNDFGLVAITRKRVKQSLERTLSTTCNVCVGTGMVKSPVTVCNDIYVEMRKMHKHLDRGDVMLRVHPEVVKQLKTTGGKWLQEMEEMVGKTILVKSDPSLHPEQFDIH
jgi:ribonuclease G